MFSSTVVFSDASDVAFGGFLVSLDGVTASGMFTSEDLGPSSTYRELKAIYYVLLPYAEHLRQRRVTVFTDNQGAARIVSVGSSKVHLQSVVLSILIFVHQMGSPLKRSRFPGRRMRELISLADSLTRTIGALILQFSAF